MGLAFKPDIDDLRESPAKGITTKVLQSCNNADIMVVEPNVSEHKLFKLRILLFSERLFLECPAKVQHLHVIPIIQPRKLPMIHQLSFICDKAGINVWELIDLANRHPRVNILQPGCGVGG